MNPDSESDLRAMLADYLALARRALRYWPRTIAIFVAILSGGMYWVIKRPRAYRSEASATVQDASASRPAVGDQDQGQAELRARLAQVYGSRANMGRIVDELNLYPWLHGKTSHMKVIESFQHAMSFAAVGRDAMHLEFEYQNPALAQIVVQRLLQLYTDERRAAGQMQVRTELGSVETAVGGLEAVISEEEERLERFERANHELVEQVRLRRLGQMQARLGVAVVPETPAEPGESVRTRRLRIRLSALENRLSALQHAVSSPQAPSASAPEPESERVQSLRHSLAELRERLERLRTTYTDEYPDVQVTARRVGDAQRELSAAVAAEGSRGHGASQAIANEPAEQVRDQMTSVAREIDDTRADLSSSVREDRLRVGTSPPVHETAPAPPPPPTDASWSASPDRPLASLVEVESVWDRLTAELTTTRTRYQQLLTRRFELQAQLDTVNTTGADVLRVIDPPSLPVEPEPPGHTKLALIVLAVALALALGVAVISGYLDSCVYEPGDVARWGELPELPAIADLREAGPVRLSIPSIRVTARPTKPSRT